MRADRADRRRRPAKLSTRPTRTPELRVFAAARRRTSGPLSAGTPVRSLDAAAVSTADSDDRLLLVAVALVFALAVALVLLVARRSVLGVRAMAAARIVADHRANLATIVLATLLGIGVGMLVVFGLPS